MLAWLFTCLIFGTYSVSGLFVKVDDADFDLKQIKEGLLKL